jgi:hypothetical protein
MKWAVQPNNSGNASVSIYEIMLFIEWKWQVIEKNYVEKQGNDFYINLLSCRSRKVEKMDLPAYKPVWWVQ